MKLPGETLLEELLEDLLGDPLEELLEDLLGDLLEELLEDPLPGDLLEDPEVLSLESDPSTEPLDGDPSRGPELLEALPEAILLLSSAGGEGEGEERPTSGAQPRCGAGTGAGTGADPGAGPEAEPPCSSPRRPPDSSLTVQTSFRSSTLALLMAAAARFTAPTILTSLSEDNKINFHERPHMT